MKQKLNLELLESPGLVRTGLEKVLWELRVYAMSGKVGSTADLPAEFNTCSEEIINGDNLPSSYGRYVGRVMDSKDTEDEKSTFSELYERLRLLTLTENETMALNHIFSGRHKNVSHIQDERGHLLSMILLYNEKGREIVEHPFAFSTPVIVKEDKENGVEEQREKRFVLGKKKELFELCEMILLTLQNTEFRKNKGWLWSA